jgi:formylglycine-generating enzyme required for sulfatase activity
MADSPSPGLPVVRSPSTIEQIWDWFVANLPQILGTGLGALLLACGAWIWTRVKATAARRLKTQASLDGDMDASHFDFDSMLTRYRVDLTRRGSILSFGDPATWSPDRKADSLFVTLDQLWTPLRVADSHSRVGRSGTHENMAEEDAGIDLRELVDSVDDDLLIIGEPGSGKSTSVAALAVDHARSWTDAGSSLLPVWVNLGSVSGLPRDCEPMDFLVGAAPELALAATRDGPDAARVLHNGILALAHGGKVIFLLDGLDEVKEHLLAAMRSMISELANDRHGSRVVVTCRSFDYRQKVPNRRVAISRELELLPYSQTEMTAYVERWYSASVRVGRFTPQQASELQSALLAAILNPEIRELAMSPLLLALLTLIHSEEAKLPDTRAVLCDRAITYMLADSARWRIREAGESTVASPPVLSLAISVAHRAHQEEEYQSPSGVPLDAIEDEARKICRAMELAETARQAPIPTDLVNRLVRGHGLLLQQSHATFSFAHRSFQEFLAGQYYAAGAHRKEALTHGSSALWREPFRLMASFAGHEGENLYYILDLITDLAFGEQQTVASTQLAGEMLVEIGKRRLALNRFAWAIDEADVPNLSIWSRVRAALNEQVEEPTRSLAERERSAAVIAVMGDFRFPTGTSDVPPSLVPIEGGVAVLGSARTETARLLELGAFVGGTRSTAVAPFKIGRYLVTNAEFRAFVDGDGYSSERYWSAVGWNWVRGDSEVVTAIRDHWLFTVFEHHGKEIRDGEIDQASLQDEAVHRTGPRNAPFYWSDRRFNRSNQPVVGVNWWEAEAFCNWLTESARGRSCLAEGWSFRLATEFEWEYAYRMGSNDSLFPWGDHWSDESGHVSSNLLNMRSPVPVGIYPPSSLGIYDMAGNVWEWTSSLFLPFEAEFDADREDSDSFEERVVRGSSWYNLAEVAMCSSRAVDRSYNLFYDVGFRLVAAPGADALGIAAG